MSMRYGLRLIIVSATMLQAQAAEGRVTRFEVEARTAFAPGTEWGQAGAYERLTGTAYMEVDPRDPLNAVIVNIDKAQLSSKGLVEFSAPFVILKPVESARGNGKVWYGINNRGRYCIELGYRGTWPDPKNFGKCYPETVEDVGANNVLLQDGYVFVDAGWQGDGIPDAKSLYPKLPIARQPDGSSIVGRVRLEYTPTSDRFSQPLVEGWRPYKPVDLDTRRATLTVRDHNGAAHRHIDPSDWAFGQCQNGKTTLVPSGEDICLFAGFKAHQIYELTYVAKDPIIMGLGYAVTRDIASFLRFARKDDAGNPNPLTNGADPAPIIRRAYSSGMSSTGMYQREFLYLGFNEDEAHRKVFDGVTIYSGGSYRLFANVEFAHPTFFARQDANSDYLSNAVFPFTFAVGIDPLTQRRDGILKRPDTDPLVIQADEETAFFQWKASLNSVDGAGQSLQQPANVRFYFMNGFGHVTAGGLLAPQQPWPSAKHQTGNIAAASVTARALVRIMDDWADKGVTPPPSNYPTSNDLVSLDEYRASFPKLPFLEPPHAIAELRVLNYGPLFSAIGGRQEQLPPDLGPAYPLLVPRPGPDGGAMSGINTIFTRAPLGTNVGWNRWTGSRSPELPVLLGSFVPFARTRAERLATGDPRLSLEERYGDHAGFVEAVRVATEELVRFRFMLREDASLFVKGAEASAVLK